ncbi:MAG: hypothetical protein V1794_09175 [Candidatus Glassbacteria bacterium]
MPPKKLNRTRFNTTLSRDTKKLLDRLSKLEGRPAGQIIDDAIENYWRSMAEKEINY